MKVILNQYFYFEFVNNILGEWKDDLKHGNGKFESGLNCKKGIYLGFKLKYKNE